LMSDTSSVSPYVRNFPFPTLREKQAYVLNEIDSALSSGYKYIILEAPTGFGKSPVAIAVARTLGTSYICTSTKDLQTQYARDFPFVKVAKGKNNFICTVKEDFIRNGTYKCVLCQPPRKISPQLEQCYHRNVDYGPCINNSLFQYDARIDDRGCKYRTLLKHYKVNNKGTTEEEVLIDEEAMN
jgi:ATP-dependent DNA helicase DinG